MNPKKRAAIALIVIIAVVTALIVRGCIATEPPAPDPAPTAVSRTPVSPQEQCVLAVMYYLDQVPDAIANGYDGVDPSELIAQYGTDSAEYRTFSYAQGLLISDIEQHGSAGSLARIQPWVRKGCREGGL